MTTPHAEELRKIFKNKTIEEILDGEPPAEEEVEAMLADLRRELGREPTADELEKVAVRLNETTTRVVALLRGLDEHRSADRSCAAHLRRRAEDMRAAGGGVGANVLLGAAIAIETFSWP